MTDSAEALERGEARAPHAEAWRRVAAAARALERARPGRVLAVFVGVQWLSVLGLALTVRHNGWIYYQGGDQLWYYTTGWLLAHGLIGVAGVGYLWSTLLAPVAAVAGPDIARAYPAIILVNVLVLAPLVTVALWGIAERIAGRLFAYWTAALWIALPFLGILYTSPGYHQRFTELFLPLATGLTGMGDLPATAATVVAMYFATRAVLDDPPSRVDALAAGLVAGAAIATKPSAALFLAGPALAFLACRRFRMIGFFVLAMAPALLTLALWKIRGFGMPEITGAYQTSKMAAGTMGVSLPSGIKNLDWHRFGDELGNVREYFWSVRAVEWVVFAGVLALARKSVRAAILVGGWFWAFVLVKGTYRQGSLTDGSLLRLLLPAAPAFVLLVAAVPLLLPGVSARLAPTPRAPRAPGAARRTTAVLVAAALATAIVPLAAIAAFPKQSGLRTAGLHDITPIPNDVDIGLRAHANDRGQVVLTWTDQHAGASALFYHVYRGSGTTSDFVCGDYVIPRCLIGIPDIATTAHHTFVDRPGPGLWHYRVAVAANWLDDPRYGDPYELSRKVAVRVAKP